MYSKIEEAYPQDKYIDKYSKENNKRHNINKFKSSSIKSVENERYKLGVIPPHAIDDEHFPPNINQKFFNAQGDMENNPYLCNVAESRLRTLDKMYQNKNIVPIRGTKISDLNKRHIATNNLSMNDLSMLDSPSMSSDMSFLHKGSINNKSTHRHDYYIKKFIQQIVDDDMMSMTSSQDNDVYDHIKKCKYCKSQINEKLKQHYKNKKNPSTKPISQNIINPKSTPTKILGYNIKEIIIIILIGLCSIFIFDLFVNIGKKIGGN
uniref:Uncharacterized protein n=1 Tax=Mimivirus LCMiAC01 TaxID=2506608 RepID=A0A481YZU0_9VIRU|nr:MAG: hypothetical protein LCMiAC01_00190 [Mimivirus LCMiAC01]